MNARHCITSMMLLLGGCVTPETIGETPDSSGAGSGSGSGGSSTTDPAADDSSTTTPDELPPPEGEQHAYQYGGELDESVMTLAFVGSDHIALAGTSNSDLDLGAGPIAPDEGGNLLLAVVGVSDGAPVLARRYAAVVDYVASVATTADGGFLLAGTFSDASTLGAFALEPIGATDAFIAELDADGEPLWIHTLGNGDDYTRGAGVIEDADGNVLALSGVSSGPLTLTKLDGAGNVLFEVTGGAYESATLYAPVSSMAIDHNGDVLAMGATYGRFAWSDDVAESGFSGIFAVKLSGADGTPLWGTEIQGGNAEGLSASSIVVDGTGDAYVSGTSGPDTQITRLAGSDGAMVWERAPLDAYTKAPHLVLGRDDSMHVLLNIGADATIDDTNVGAGAWLAAVDRADGSLSAPIEIPQLGDAIFVSQAGEFGLGDMAISASGEIAIETCFFDPVTTPDGERTSAGWGDILLIAIDPQSP